MAAGVGLLIGLLIGRK
ncbi:TPA: hypothetical protein ACXLVU_004228 [Salmonella enterica]|nr:hypothetical protein [Salmonella enterica]